jgi:glycosyltransferase involved in cell wall biosynthesis
MTSLGLVRDCYLNPWDVGNYSALADLGIDLYVCGHGPNVDWEQILELYPNVKPVKYDHRHEVLDLELDVLDLPDAHYPFTQYFAKRHERTVIVAWDNLPGKNTLRPEALEALQDCWKTVARSALAKATLRFDGVPQEKIRTIPGAVDTKFFHPGKESERQDVVLFVGRVTPEKGLLDLIWAMKGVDAELWIAGGGNMADYTGWIERCNVKATYLGQLTRRELAEVYRKVKVLCVPSIPLLSLSPDAAWLEQFGQVFIEAMASGTPVVSTESGAIPEVVQTGGYLVAPRDWNMLHHTLKAMLNPASQMWAETSFRARCRAVANYAQGVVARMIKEWYEL